MNHTGKTFFEAIIATSYIEDTTLRDAVYRELIETNEIMRRPKITLEPDGVKKVMDQIRTLDVERRA